MDKDQKECGDCAKLVKAGVGMEKGKKFDDGWCLRFDKKVNCTPEHFFNRYDRLEECITADTPAPTEPEES
jgi:hypothetical protein